ncbi:MAG: hypothetical protein JSS28_04030 [Proteobacteria bacterium]|nr:hypothetical protein [Pseudomonadota bacterium]
MQPHPSINDSAAAEVFVTPALFDRIVESSRNLIAIRTANTPDVIAQFRVLALRTGQSVYYWQDEAGITSLRERDLRVPGSKRATDALRYILQSPQFGIYLFSDFAEHLRPPNTGLLRQIARSRVVAGRKVVFVGETIAMPEGMDALVEVISHQPVAGTRPRLRDGRWVT